MLRLGIRENGWRNKDIMKRIIWYIGIGLLLCSCGSSKHYGAFQYDNGDDYVSEGLYRIVDRKGHIGYALSLIHI